ncbi:hypothetical protein OY671_008269, partial [Metschnikowia pulcherrima]
DVVADQDAAQLLEHQDQAVGHQHSSQVVAAVQVAEERRLQQIAERGRGQFIARGSPAPSQKAREISPRAALSRKIFPAVIDDRTPETDIVSNATHARKMDLAVAQMGAVNSADTRAVVVRRLVEMMREAAARKAEFVVFPELASTTFFPRYWMEDAEAVDRFFEKSMPNADVQPSFDTARELGIGFYSGYAESTPEGRQFNTAISVDRQAKIIGKYRKIHSPGHSDHKPEAPFQHSEKKFFEVGDSGFGVWETNDVKIGMCSCNDRRWPETYRVMSSQSAESIVSGYNT